MTIIMLNIGWNGIFMISVGAYKINNINDGIYDFFIICRESILTI